MGVGIYAYFWPRAGVLYRVEGLRPFCFYAGLIMRRIVKAAREAKTCGGGGSVEGPGAEEEPGAAGD